MTPQSPTPWLLNKRWRDGKVIDGMGTEVALAWFFVGFVGMFTAGCIFGFIKHRIPLNDFPVVIAIAIPLMELVLIFQALRKTARWLRFGRSVFEMATFPGVIGGQLVGIVYTQVRLQAQDGFHVSLACIHSVWSGHGNGAHRNDIVVWHDEQHLVRGAMEQDMTRSAIPIGFRIPRDCLPSFHAAGYDDVTWKLRIPRKSRASITKPTLKSLSSSLPTATMPLPRPSIPLLPTAPSKFARVPPAKASVSGKMPPEPSTRAFARGVT